MRSTLEGREGPGLDDGSLLYQIQVTGGRRIGGRPSLLYQYKQRVENLKDNGEREIIRSPEK